MVYYIYEYDGWHIIQDKPQQNSNEIGSLNFMENWGASVISLVADFIEVPQNWPGFQSHCSSHCQGFQSNLRPLQLAAFAGESGCKKGNGEF